MESEWVIALINLWYWLLVNIDPYLSSSGHVTVLCAAQMSILAVRIFIFATEIPKKIGIQSGSVKQVF